MLVLHANLSAGSVNQNTTQNSIEVYHITYATLCSLIALATVIGNVLLFHTVLTSSQLRTATNSLLLSLATADLVAGAVMVPLYVQQFISSGGKSDGHSEALCLIRKFLFMLTSGASITSLAVVSLDRMFAVSRPFVYARIVSAKLVAVLIITVWTVCITLTSCAVFIPVRSWGPFVKTCRPGVPQTSYLIVTPALFYLPGVVILLSYIKIFSVARIHRRKITVQSEPSYLPPSVSAIEVSKTGLDMVTIGNERSTTLTTTSHKKSTSTMRSKRISRMRNTLSNDLKAAKTVSILVGLFLVCWLPVATFYIYINLAEIDVTSSEKFTYMHDAFMMLSFMNSTIDPVLYIFLNKDIKSSLKRNFRSIFKTDRQ